MTAKSLRKEGVIDCTRGVSREQRAINRRNKLAPIKYDVPKRSADGSKRYKDLNHAINNMRRFHAQWAALKEYRQQQIAEVKKRFGQLPDRAVTGSSLVEEPFDEQAVTSANDTQVLSRIVVSLALFDGDKMLFACSGIPLPDKTPTKLHLTRFVTSAHLAHEFNANRYKNDKLRVKVRLPHNQIVDGLLGLYDDDIAIVTSLCILDVHPVDLDEPVDLDLLAKCVCEDDRILAVGCAFKSGSLMTTNGSLCRESPCTWVPDTQNLFKAVLGGPLIGKGGKFLGMNVKHLGDTNMMFLSQKFLRERLEHFQILNPKELHFRGYKVPEGVSRIVPSGFVDNMCWIISCGYPIPPPLMLEFNGALLNRFEELFGEIIAWKGYPFPCPPKGSEYGVWARLPKKVVTDVSRSVVSVTSFIGDERFFACTGLLIRWRGKTWVLTSASLVRSRYNENKIDNQLRIKVFLPLNHINRVSGTLEWYSLHYNIAVVSVTNDLGAIRPADIFNQVQESPGKVVAIGRDPELGLLMGSLGVVMMKYKKKDVKLSCKDLQLSTCKIKKAGIGGPLISLDGTFVGMNFYDGREVTPFLPLSKIQKVLNVVKDPLSLPSQRGESMLIPHPEECVSGKTRRKKNKWPVPEAYWYHGQLDVDRYHVPELPGRRLN